MTFKNMYGINCQAFYFTTKGTKDTKSLLVLFASLRGLLP